MLLTVVGLRPLPPCSVRLAGLLARGGRRALAEAVLEAAVDVLHVPHAARARGLAALGLLGPVVVPDIPGGVAAGGALLLLEVERPLAATDAEAVGLLVALAHGRRAVTAARHQRHEVERGPLAHAARAELLAVIKGAAAEGYGHVIAPALLLQVHHSLGGIHTQQQGLAPGRARKDLHRR